MCILPGALSLKTIDKEHFVYIVQCRDGTLYTGYSNHPANRVAIHNLGKGAKYTRSRRPVLLLYTERCKDLSAAFRREHAIKRMTREEKLLLCAKAD